MTGRKSEEMQKFQNIKAHDCVILAAGSYPCHPAPLAILREAKHVICCDGAAEAYISQGHTPLAIVGDGDSLPSRIKEQYGHLIHTIEEQEYNDLTKATQFAISQGFRSIAYIGCTGLREDHTLGNISLMAFYLQKFNIQPTMYTDHGIFTPASGTQSFPSFPHQQVSIFRVKGTTLSSEQLRWNSYPYSQLWQGTLNEALNCHFTLHSDGIYIVFQTYEETAPAANKTKPIANESDSSQDT